MARVNEESHRFTCHQHAHPRMEWAILLLISSRSASPRFIRYSFHVPQRVGGWAGQVGWLHTEVVCPPDDGHPSQYQTTDSAAAGDRTHDHWVENPITTRLPSHPVEIGRMLTTLPFGRCSLHRASSMFVTLHSVSIATRQMHHRMHFVRTPAKNYYGRNHELKIWETMTW